MHMYAHMHACTQNILKLFIDNLRISFGCHGMFVAVIFPLLMYRNSCDITITTYLTKIHIDNWHRRNMGQPFYPKDRQLIYFLCVFCLPQKHHIQSMRLRLQILRQMSIYRQRKMILLPFKNQSYQLWLCHNLLPPHQQKCRFVQCTTVEKIIHYIIFSCFS